MTLLDRLFAWRLVCRAPPYDPKLWEFWTIQLSNNCYDYATNLKTSTYAQPGYASGNRYSEPPTCAGVGAGAMSDGLKPVDCDRGCGCRECCIKVALVVSPGTPVPVFDQDGYAGYESAYYDYHFYRVDDNGMWSHKPGARLPTNLDASGNLISDPRTADRGPYTTFCGCYCVCEGKVTIKGLQRPPP
jgi:hypothetical protein